MWDNAPLLRGIANTLFAFSILLALYGVIRYAVGQPAVLPLHSVRLEEIPRRIDAASVLHAVRSETRGNLLTVDIERVRQAVEALPWVRNVSVRREFPDRLVVRLVEHRALARWNGAQLVNTDGEVFAAEAEEILPEFYGPEETAAEMTGYYGEFSRQLETVGLRMTQLTLTPRHAWRLKLSEGLMLELGRDEVQKRLARFVAVYPYGLAAEQGRVKYVDLRYRNGFAVGGLSKQG